MPQWPGHQGCCRSYKEVQCWYQACYHHPRWEEGWGVQVETNVEVAKWHHPKYSGWYCLQGSYYLQKYSPACERMGKTHHHRSPCLWGSSKSCWHNLIFYSFFMAFGCPAVLIYMCFILIVWCLLPFNKAHNWEMHICISVYLCTFR